jgi:hypothetical protein
LLLANRQIFLDAVLIQIEGGHNYEFEKNSGRDSKRFFGANGGAQRLQ